MSNNTVSRPRKSLKKRYRKTLILSEAKLEVLEKARQAYQLKCRLKREEKQALKIAEKNMVLTTGLTQKQRGLVLGLAQGLPKSEAGLKAGYAPDSVASSVYNALQSPNVQESLHNLMEAAGLGTDKLLAVHKEMLQATKVVSVVSGKDANGSTMDFIDVPDWTARGQGLNMGYKLKGLYADQNVNVSVESHEQRMQRLLGMPIDVTPRHDSDE